MDATTRKVLWGVGIGCVVALFLTVAGGYVLWAKLVAPEFRTESIDTPAKAGTVGVSVGAGFLRSEVVFSDADLGLVTDIAFGKLDPNPAVAMAVAGNGGADLLSSQMKVVGSFRFPEDASADVLQVVDVERDGTCEFLDRGNLEQGPALFDHRGNVVWTYQVETRGGYASNACAGDANGDGVLEFAVGFGGDGGVHLLDQKGHKMWAQEDGNVWHTEMVDLNGDGGAEIVHSNVGGELRIRDGRGRLHLARRLAGPGIFPNYLGSFSVTKWPTASGRWHVLYPTGKDFRVADGAGEVVARLPAPVVDDNCGTWAAPVRLRAKAPAYFALLADFPLADRAALHVYDAQQKLVYREVLPEPAGALVTLPQTDGTEALLVGGQGRVLKYVASPAK